MRSPDVLARNGIASASLSSLVFLFFEVFPVMAAVASDFASVLTLFFSCLTVTDVFVSSSPSVLTTDGSKFCEGLICRISVTFHGRITLACLSYIK